MFDWKEEIRRIFNDREWTVDEFYDAHPLLSRHLIFNKFYRGTPTVNAEKIIKVMNTRRRPESTIIISKNGGEIYPNNILKLRGRTSPFISSSELRDIGIVPPGSTCPYLWKGRMIPYIHFHSTRTYYLVNEILSYAGLPLEDFSYKKNSFPKPSPIGPVQKTHSSTRNVVNPPFPRSEPTPHVEVTWEDKHWEEITLPLYLSHYLAHKAMEASVKDRKSSRRSALIQQALEEKYGEEARRFVSQPRQT